MFKFEEKKIFEHQPLQNPSLKVPQWYWQSDADPWKEKDSTKWLWTPYSYNDCCSFEKALFLNQTPVDLGGYEIDLNKMLQVNKKDKNKVRRIKREVNSQQESRFLIELPQPSIISNIQKTINHAFGNVQHFLDYLAKRTLEAKEIFERLKSLSLDCKKHDYIDIIHKVITCIKKGGETREKVTKTRALGMNKNFILEARWIIDEIETRCKAEDVSLKDFLRVILRIYTMESFVCYWLNELLRSESWEEINVLTPYLVCLTYAFQLKDYVIKYETHGVKDTFLGIIKKRKLRLYRGTALTEEQLACYDPQKDQFFSWKGVTSTSRNQKQALGFIKHSLQKATSKSQKLAGVLFIIKVKYTSSGDCEGMIDVAQDSKYPQEEEVILAPGTVFKLMKVRLNKNNNIHEIKLKIKKTFKKKEKNVSLLGDLQKGIITENFGMDSAELSAKMSNEEVMKALKLLQGNQLIEILRIAFSSYMLDEGYVHFKDTFQSLKSLRLLSLRFDNESLTVKHFKNLAISFKPLKSLFSLSIFIQNSIPQEAWYSIKDCLKQLSSLQVLLLHISCPENVHWNSIKEGLISLTSLKNLSLDINSQKIPNEDLIGLMTCLRLFSHLDGLSLRIQKECEFTSNAFSVLGNSLKVLKSLQSLALEFPQSKMGDHQLQSLISAFYSLLSLHKLRINFGGCRDITEEEVISLTYVMRLLMQLEELDLNFAYCENISNKGFNGLVQSLISMRHLKRLSLSLQGCEKVTGKEMNSFNGVFAPLKALKSLDINLAYCKDLSDNGVNCLKEAITSLTDLQELKLGLNDCKKISQDVLSDLKTALQDLVSPDKLRLIL